MSERMAFKAWIPGDEQAESDYARMGKVLVGTEPGEALEAEEAARVFVARALKAGEIDGETRVHVRDPNGSVTQWLVTPKPTVVFRAKPAPAPTDENASRPSFPVDREAGGRLVREVWVDFASKQPNPKPHHLLPWEQLDEANKEVDRRIAERVARWALAGRDVPSIGDVVVIEDVDDTGTRWHVSFAGPNPMPDHAVRCASREDAFRLKDLVGVFAKNASRPVLTEEEAARITASLNIDVGPDFTRFVAAQTKVTAALMRVSSGDYRTGDVAAPKASEDAPVSLFTHEEERAIIDAGVPAGMRHLAPSSAASEVDPLAGLPEEERKRILAVAEKAAEHAWRFAGDSAKEPERRETIAREVAAYRARQVPEMLTREETVSERRIVHCTVCNKTHAVKRDETPCAPGAWGTFTPEAGSHGDGS